MALFLLLKHPVVVRPTHANIAAVAKILESFIFKLLYLMPPPKERAIILFWKIKKTIMTGINEMMIAA